MASLFSSSVRALARVAGAASQLASKTTTRSYQIPAKTVKSLKVYQPLPKKTFSERGNLINTIESDLLAKADTDGWKNALLDRKNESRLKPGDIVRVVKHDKSHFSGMVIGINRNGLATSILIRNKITGLGVENRFLLYSPTIQNVYVTRRPVKAKRRAKLYYVRGSPKHDVSEIQ